MLYNGAFPLTWSTGKYGSQSGKLWKTGVSKTGPKCTFSDLSRRTGQEKILCSVAAVQRRSSRWTGLTLHISGTVGNFLERFNFSEGRPLHYCTKMKLTLFLGSMCNSRDESANNSLLVNSQWLAQSQRAFVSKLWRDNAASDNDPPHLLALHRQETRRSQYSICLPRTCCCCIGRWRLFPKTSSACHHGCRIANLQKRRITNGCRSQTS